MTDLHLILYRWGEDTLLGGRGFGPVGTSILGDAPMRHWDRLIRAYLRKGASGMRSRWYLPFENDHAALIWSDPGTNAPLRTRRAVVLIGPDQSLGWQLAATVPDGAFAELAQPQEGRPPPVASALLEGWAAEEGDAVRRCAGEDAHVEAAARLVAARWAAPFSPVAVQESEAPRAVLWNAQHVLDAMSEGATSVSDTRVGFAAAAGWDPLDKPLPALTLWPPGPRTAGPGTGPRPVQPGDDPPGAALYLVRYHRDHGAASLRHVLDRSGVLGSPRPASRIRRARELWESATQEEPTVEPTMEPAASPATPSGAPDGVLCPICLSRVTPDRDALFIFSDGTYRPLRLPDGATPQQRDRELRRSQVRCPNRDPDIEEHYLPYRYVDSDPVVISFVGSSASGKTHLLAAMIGAVQRRELAAFGLDAEPLDVRQHEAFRATKVLPLLEDGRVLQRTRPDIHHAEAGLLVTAPGSAPRALALFDVQGEDLALYSKAEQRRFLDAVHGLVFVIDPDQLDGGAALGDPSFSTILDLLPDPQGTAAALVLAKADQLRFTYPVDRWLRRPSTGLDAGELLAESEEIYAYLHQNPATRPWLHPYTACRRATLHAVSATGGPVNAAGDRFVRPVRPQRVLEPLVALLAMTGAIDSDEARKVGR